VNPLGDRYGRAPTVCLAEKVGSHRVPEVAGIVVYGSDHEAVAKRMLRDQAANMLVVLSTKPKKDSPVNLAKVRLESKVTVTVVVIAAKARPCAIDLRAGRIVEPIEYDGLPRPPQTQTAPSIPERFRKKAAGPRPPAPSVPAKLRKKPAEQAGPAPSSPREPEKTKPEKKPVK